MNYSDKNGHHTPNSKKNNNQKTTTNPYDDETSEILGCDGKTVPCEDLLEDLQDLRGRRCKEFF